MGKKLYIGNLAYSVTEDALNEFFGAVGAVESCRIITDKFTGKSKGFGFIEMDSDDNAKACIEQLDGKEIDGRALRVSEAREKPAGGGGGRGGYGGGGGGGGRGGYGGGGGGRGGYGGGGGGGGRGGRGGY